MIRFGVAVFDHALIVALAALVPLWWRVLRLGFGSNPGHLANDYDRLAVVAAGVAAWLFWSATRGRAIRRGWRITGVAVSAALVGLVCFQVRVLTLGAGESDSTQTSHQRLVGLGGTLLIVLAFVLLVVLRRRALARGWLTGTVRVVLAAALVGYVVYLRRDEAPAPSIARNQAALAGGCDDAVTCRLTLRYTAGADGSRVFVAPPRKLQFGQKGEALRAYVLAHRAEIEANWAGMTEVRAWWAEMAAQPRLGDCWSGDWNESSIAFDAVSVYCNHALDIACLQALDGDGDGALARAGDVYKVGVRLESGARTPIRFLIGVEVQQRALESVGFVLDHATPSAKGRQDFARLLAEKSGGGAGAKRLALLESTGLFYFSRQIPRIPRLPEPKFPRESWLCYLVRFADGLALGATFNPQATFNRLNDHIEQCASFAETRQLDKLDRINADASADQLLGHFQAKNLLGRMLLYIPMSMSPPFFSTVQEYWKVEDQRAALMKRLGEAPAPVVK